MRRRLTRAALAAALALTCVAGPAQAADPYRPFDESPQDDAQRTVDRLNRQLLPGSGPALAPDALERGVVLRRKAGRGGRGHEFVPVPHSSKATLRGDSAGVLARAGVDRPTDGSPPSVWWLVLVAAGLALGAVVVELRSVRLQHSP